MSKFSSRLLGVFNRTPEITLWIVGVGAIMALSSCNHSVADLTVVQNYAKATANADAGFAALADDLYQSCLRYSEYSEGLMIAGRPLWEDREDITKSVAAGPNSSAAAPLNRPDCQNSYALSRRWNLENQVLLGYVRALGAVAGVSADPDNLDAFSAALNRAGSIADDGVAKAAGALATKIAEALVAARQRRDVYEIASAARTGGINQLASSLQQVALLDYRTKIENERINVESYYATVIGNEARQLYLLTCNTASSNAFASSLHCTRYPAYKKITLRERIVMQGEAAQLRDLIRKQRADRQVVFDQIADHNAAAAAYADAIGEIAKGNDAILTEPAGDINGLVSALRPYVDELSGATAALVAAMRK